MSPTCLIQDPIHPIGAEMLRAAGCTVLEPRSLQAFEQSLTQADAIIVRNGLSATHIDRAPRLTLIANHGTGIDKIAVEHATRLGIAVTSTPGSNALAVAEHALMLMLAVSRQVALSDSETRQGRWAYKYSQPFLSLSGRTLGIIGFGLTGRELCRMARAGLNMRVLAWSPNANAQELTACGAESAPSLEALLEQADVVSVHRPLRPDTHHTLNDAAFRRMKPTAIVVNTSRGGLIDEIALIAALREGRLFGAGLDVFDTEPLPANVELATLPNVILTPHMAGSTQEALRNTATQCVAQVIATLGGHQPANLVRPEVWPVRRRVDLSPSALADSPL